MMVVAFSILIDCSITILSFQLQSILEKTNSLPTLWKLSDNQSLGGKQKFGAPSKASYSEKCYIQSFFFFFFFWNWLVQIPTPALYIYTIFTGYFPLTVITKYCLYSLYCTIYPWAYLTPSLASILPPTTGNHSFVLYICKSASFVILTFVIFFRLHI